jgi:hypothetical protein
LAVARRSGWPIRQPSPKNSPGSQDGNHRLLGLLGGDDDFYLALVDVEHRVGRTGLPEDDRFPGVVGDGATAIDGGEEGLGIEGGGGFLGHGRLPAMALTGTCSPSPAKRSLWRDALARQSAPVGHACRPTACLAPKTQPCARKGKQISAGITMRCSGRPVGRCVRGPLASMFVQPKQAGLRHSCRSSRQQPAASTRKSGSCCSDCASTPYR